MPLATDVSAGLLRRQNFTSAHDNHPSSRLPKKPPPTYGRAGRARPHQTTKQITHTSWGPRAPRSGGGGPRGGGPRGPRRGDWSRARSCCTALPPFSSSTPPKASRGVDTNRVPAGISGGLGAKGYTPGGGPGGGGGFFAGGGGPGGGLGLERSTSSSFFAASRARLLRASSCNWRTSPSLSANKSRMGTPACVTIIQCGARRLKLSVLGRSRESLVVSRQS